MNSIIKTFLLLWIIIEWYKRNICEENISWLYSYPAIRQRQSVLSFCQYYIWVAGHFPRRRHHWLKTRISSKYSNCWVLKRWMVTCMPKLHPPTFYKAWSHASCGAKTKRWLWFGFTKWDGLNISYQVASDSFIVSVSLSVCITAEVPHQRHSTCCVYCA